MTPPEQERGATPDAHRDVAPSTLKITHQPSEAIAADTTAAGRHWQQHLLFAIAEWAAPAGRRHLGAVIVRRCPACRHLHQHRAMSLVEARGAIKTGSCGATYKLDVHPILPIGGAA